jgi:hypothetical protein
MLKQKSRLGPNPYVGGGFTLVFDEFEVINSAWVKCSNDDVLAVADTQYALRVAFATNVVTITVFACAAGAWTELAAGALNGLTFTVTADCE